MFSWDDPADRVAIAQMNSELQHAELELLSAHCATHQLRLRYSIDNLARFGRRDVLRKSFQAAAALSQYYGSIEKKIPPAEAAPESNDKITDEKVAGAVTEIAGYLREQRDSYLPTALPLSDVRKARMWPFFSPALLDRVRVVELAGKNRIPTPPFYGEYKTLGYLNLPEVTHMPSMTFVDVIVFNELMTDRSLFHGLVHVVQFEVLGLERYVELFVRGFVKTKLHYCVPLEAHAFSLESKYASAPVHSFPVEQSVRLWVQQDRYESR